MGMIIYYENNRENTIGIDMTFINKTERDQTSNLLGKTKTVTQLCRVSALKISQNNKMDKPMSSID